MCKDNKRINQIIVKYRFPIATFLDLLDQLDSARVFLKVDLHSVYHQIKVWPIMSGKQH